MQSLDLYFCKRPSFEAENSDCDAFYLRPLDKFDASDPECPWFYARAVGHNSLKGMLKARCREGGIPFADGSNHSLRATGATRMLDAGVPEKVIMDRTGHHSLDGLKPYARVTDFQQQQVSAVTCMTRSEVKETSVLHEVQNVPSTQDLGAKVEVIKGIVSNNQITGCIFNI